MPASGARAARPVPGGAGGARKVDFTGPAWLAIVTPAGGGLGRTPRRLPPGSRPRSARLAWPGPGATASSGRPDAPRMQPVGRGLGFLTCWRGAGRRCGEGGATDGPREKAPPAVTRGAAGPGEPVPVRAPSPRQAPRRRCPRGSFARSSPWPRPSADVKTTFLAPSGRRRGSRAQREALPGPATVTSDAGRCPPSPRAPRSPRGSTSRWTFRSGTRTETRSSPSPP